MWEFAFGVLKELPNRRLFWLAIAIACLLAFEPVMAWRSAFIAQSRLQREQALSQLAELREANASETHKRRRAMLGRLVSPDGAAGLQSVLAKLHTLITSWPGYTEDQLRGIRAPTLLAMGDRDFITAEHFARMASLIPNAHYAVLPGTTHMTILQRGDWLEPMMAARFSA